MGLIAAGAQVETKRILTLRLYSEGLQVPGPAGQNRLPDVAATVPPSEPPLPVREWPRVSPAGLRGEGGGPCPWTEPGRRVHTEQHCLLFSLLFLQPHLLRFPFLTWRLQINHIVGSQHRGPHLALGTAAAIMGRSSGPRALQNRVAAPETNVGWGDKLALRQGLPGGGAAKRWGISWWRE